MRRRRRHGLDACPKTAMTGAIVSANPAAEKIFGLHSSDVVGKTVMSIHKKKGVSFSRFEKVINMLAQQFKMYVVSGDNDSEKKNLSAFFRNENMMFNQKPDEKLFGSLLAMSCRRALVRCIGPRKPF